MTVKVVDSMADMWIDEMVGSMADCWAETMAMTRAGWMTVNIAG